MPPGWGHQFYEDLAVLSSCDVRCSRGGASTLPPTVTVTVTFTVAVLHAARGALRRARVRDRTRRGGPLYERHAG